MMVNLQDVSWLRVEHIESYGDLVDLAESYGFIDTYEEWNCSVSEALELDCIEYMHQHGVIIIDLEMEE